MACEFVIEGKGHQKPKACGKPETSDKRCAEHQPKARIAKAEATPLSWMPKAKSDKSVDKSFQTLCDSNKLFIQNVCTNGAQPGGMPFKGKGGVFSLLHKTQPGQNLSIFYNWTGDVMEVYGIGGHTTDNKHYSLTWFDGSKASPDLGKKTI